MSQQFSRYSLPSSVFRILSMYASLKSILNVMQSIAISMSKFMPV